MEPLHKTIAIVATHPPLFQSLAGPFLAELVERGWQVLCLGPDSQDESIDWLRQTGAVWRPVPTHREGFDPSAQVRNLAALSRAFKSEKVDAVLGLGLNGAVLAALSGRMARVARVVSVIDEIAIELRSARGLRQRVRRETTRRLYGVALSRSHAAVFQNEDDPHRLVELGAMPRGIEVHVVGGSGVDLQSVGQQVLPPIVDGLTFLMAAPLLEHKGVVTYCRAAKLMSQRQSRAHWQLLGPPGVGPAAISLEQLSALDAPIEYLGPDGDLIEALGRAHVFVLPSELEGMPEAVVHALAVGRPIITSDIPGCRETVDEVVNGILVPPGDAEALAKAMESILRRPDLIPSMARASRKKAERWYDRRSLTRALFGAVGLRRDDEASQLRHAS